MSMAQHDQVEQVYKLLDSHGPATAYDYMEHAGGLDHFPLHLLRAVNWRLLARQRERQNRSRGHQFLPRPAYSAREDGSQALGVGDERR